MRREDSPSVNTQGPIQHVVTTKHRCYGQLDQRDDGIRRRDRQPGNQCNKASDGEHQDQFGRNANEPLRDLSAGLDRNVRQRQSQLGLRIAGSVASCQRGIAPFCRRQQLEKLSNNVIGLQPDRFGVFAYERAAKNAGRPSRDVVLLEVVEQRMFDLIDSANASSVRPWRSRWARSSGPSPWFEFRDILEIFNSKGSVG